MNVVDPHFSNCENASALMPTSNLYSMYGYATHGLWVKWVMSQVYNGLRELWVKLRDPSSTLMVSGHHFQHLAEQKNLNRSNRKFA
jgi:hypothetical protein